MADPITREQVERLIAEAQHASGFALAQAALRILGNGWLTKCPRYVAEAFDVRVTLPEAYRAALTRWRDELAAAEPVRCVARWDASERAYKLDPHHEPRPEVAYVLATSQWCRENGYEIEGGPEPKPAGDSSERLRERREALGLSRQQASNLAPMMPACYVAILEEESRDDAGGAAIRAAYAAALSAEEARRAARTIDTSGPITIVAPAGLRLVVNGLAHSGSVYRPVDGDTVSVEAWVEAPERAPEVVDVPQPETWHARLVRLAAEAQAASKACAEAETAFIPVDAERERVRLVRAAAREACWAARKALTEATTARAIIDAQQGGAS